MAAVASSLAVGAGMLVSMVLRPAARRAPVPATPPIIEQEELTELKGDVAPVVEVRGQVQREDFPIMGEVPVAPRMGKVMPSRRIDVEVGRIITLPPRSKR